MDSSSSYLRGYGLWVTDAARLRFKVRSLGRHRDFERAQAVFAGHSGWTVMQHALNKVADLSQVGIRESGQKMVGERLRAAIRSQESGGDLPDCSHQNGCFGTYDLGADVIAVDSLHVGFDITDCASRVFQVDHAGNHVAILGYLRSDGDGGIRLYFNHFVAHETTPQVEVVNGVVVEHHAIYVGLVSRERRHILVATDGLEDHGFADLAGLDPLHRSRIGRIITAHEADLQANPVGVDGGQCRVSVGEVGRQWCFTQNMLSRRGRGANSLCVELVGRGDQHATDVLVPDHFLQTGERMVDFQLGGDLAGACGGDIRNRHQAGVGHEPAKILGMPLAHLTYAQHSNPKFRHSVSLSSALPYRFGNRPVRDSLSIANGPKWRIVSRIFRKARG